MQTSPPIPAAPLWPGEHQPEQAHQRRRPSLWLIGVSVVLALALIGTTLATVSAQGQASTLRTELTATQGDLASAETTSENLKGELTDVQNELGAARRHATTCERGLDGLVRVTLSLIKSGRRQSREGALSSLLAAAFVRQANARYRAAKPAILSCKNGPPEGALS